jgi:hypothetical protein
LSTEKFQVILIFIPMSKDNDTFPSLNNTCPMFLSFRVCPGIPIENRLDSGPVLSPGQALRRNDIVSDYSAVFVMRVGY